MSQCSVCSSFFFFNDTATTEIYTLSLHDALPIYGSSACPRRVRCVDRGLLGEAIDRWPLLVEMPCSSDRKSTRLNSSHSQISYAVFCLKKKKNDINYLAVYRTRHVSTRPLSDRTR